MQRVSQNTDTCKVLYLFSGCARKGSVSFWTRKLAAKWQVKVQIDMVDIKVRPHLDVTKRAVQQSLLNKIKAGVYAAIILSPPCSTFHTCNLLEQKGAQTCAYVCAFTRAAKTYLDREEEGQLGKRHDRFFI